MTSLCKLSKLCVKMTTIGVPSQVVGWIRSFLTGNSFQVRIEDVISIRCHSKQSSSRSSVFLPVACQWPIWEKKVQTWTSKALLKWMRGWTTIVCSWMWQRVNTCLLEQTNLLPGVLAPLAQVHCKKNLGMLINCSHGPDWRSGVIVNFEFNFSACVTAAVSTANQWVLWWL